MIINIPDNLDFAFLTFLDIAQSKYTESDIKKFTQEEFQVIKLVDNLFIKHGYNPLKRYRSQLEAQNMSLRFGQIFPGVINEL